MTKGDKTRQFIIETSIPLFSEKGYTAVSMKDICERCQMSRGGVYRHFSSTKEIFSELLRSDLELNKSIVEENIGKGISAVKILNAYFKQEIEAIYSENNGLFFAIHEFAFAESDQQSALNKHVEDSIGVLESLFRYGQSSGEFKSFDPKVVATHVIYFMDSLKTSASILSLSHHSLEEQINLLKELII